MSILKKVSKKLSITITAAVMFLYAVNSVIVSAQNVYEIYSFTGYPQQYDTWCWVASAETSGKYLVNSSKTQSDAVKYVKKRIVYEGGNHLEIAKAANYFTNFQYNYKGYLQAYPLSFLRGQIEDDRLPILCAGHYTPSGDRDGGHATTCYMVAYCSDGTNLIGYYDPWMPGRRYICIFDDFCSGKYNKRQYDQTIYTNI
jgi:hypothetical protein